MKTLTTTLIAALAAAPAMASNIGGQLNPTPVPEISAMEGVAALALLVAAVALVWERRRRAS